MKGYEGGIYLELIDLDLEIQTLSSPPIIINNIPLHTEDDSNRLNDLMYTKLDDDVYTNIPSCGCGSIRGEMNLGVVCSYCCTDVSRVISNDLESRVWIKAPEGVVSLINPSLLILLKKRFTIQGLDIIRYLTDIGYKPSNRRSKVLAELTALNVQRGYNHFIENFDSIIDTLFKLPSAGAARRQEDDIRKFIRLFKNIIFPQHVPVLNKSLMVFEDTHQGNFVDSLVPKIVDQVKAVAGIDVRENFSLRKKENRIAKVLNGLAEVYHDLHHKDFLTGKSGLYRRHVISTRATFTARAVITSITDPGPRSGIHIPWAHAVVVFTYVICNYMLKEGYTAREAMNYIFEHTLVYSEKIDRYLNHFLNSHPLQPMTKYDFQTSQVITDYDNPLKSFHGIPFFMGRNPTLNLNSLQESFATYIKKDPEDMTVSINIQTTKPMNADKLPL